MPSIDISAHLIKQTQRIFAQYNIALNQPLWVAFSGGCDSSCLLHILCQLIDTRHIHLIHINHQLSPDANQWEQHCQQVASSLRVPFHCIRLTELDGCHTDIEAQARAARYNAFSTLLPPAAVLLQGHHLNDQAETVLMRLLRGSGPNGLAGIPAYRQHQHFVIFRPLLQIQSAVLKAYAHAQRLNWVEDESNQQTCFTRNYIRHEMIPKLEKKWPAAVVNIARSAEHCRAQNSVVQSFLEHKMIAICEENRLHIPSLLMEPPHIQKSIMQSWQKTWSPYPLSSKQLATLFSSVLTAKVDREPSMVHGGFIMRRYRTYLYAISKAPIVLPTVPITWPSHEPTVCIPSIGIRLTRHVTGEGSLYQGPLTIRFRQGGERFHAQGRQGSHPVKKLFQSWGIPPWERPYIPLVYAGTLLVAIPGYGLSAHPQAQGSITIKPIAQKAETHSECA